MDQFFWLGGNVGVGNNWSSGGTTGTAPGSTDFAVFNGGGLVSGTATVGPASFSGGTFVFNGANLIAGGETVSSGASITQVNGTNSITSGNSLTLTGGYVLSGGSLLGANAAEAISGTFNQSGGSNTINELGIYDAVYTLKSGALAIVSGAISGGDEYVGLFASGGFIQSGGTHTVTQALQIGYAGGLFTPASGTYKLISGLLSMPFSSGASPTGEYIGENGGGIGTFIQTGGTNSVADRIVIGTIDSDNGVGGGSGSYTLGGSGVMIVNTLFVGSEQLCSGTFNFDTAKGDNALLTISGTNPSFPGLVVGGDGSGVFIQGSGTVDASLQVGRHYDGTGTYLLNGGTLKTDAGKDETIGAAGTGTFDQVAGTNSISGNLYIGSGTQTIIGFPGGIYYGSGLYELDHIGVLTVAQHIVLGVSAGTVGTLEVDPSVYPGAKMTVSATDSATALTVGGSGSGTFEEFNGSVTLYGSGSTPVLDVGSGSSGVGFVDISGGVLIVSATGTPPGGLAGPVVIGDSGSGTYEQVAGSVTFGGDLYDGAYGSGSFSLHGAATTNLSISGGILVGYGDAADGVFNYNTSKGDAAVLKLGSSGYIDVGDLGTGVFNLGGGVITASGLYVGESEDIGPGEGYFNLSGGTLNVTSGQAIVGDAGEGYFVQSGGSATASFGGGLDLGADATGYGAYTLSGAKLTVGSANNQSTLLVVGDAGSGQYTQSDGTGVFNGGLVVGAQAGGSGSFILSSGVASVAGGAAVIGQSGNGTYVQSGGTANFKADLTIGQNANAGGTLVLAGSGSAAVTGEIDLGVSAGATGVLDFNSGGGGATLTGTPNFKIGIGGSAALNEGAGTLKAADVALGTQSAGSGLLNVSGGALSMTTLELGSLNSGSGTSGGTGTLIVAGGGYASVAKTLTLNDFASANSNLIDTFSGGITISGGSLEVGGSKGGLAANTLQIDAGGTLVGHGVIQGGTAYNNFNVTISKGGTLEAKNGLLVISGNLSGSGTVQIDSGGTAEIVGFVSSGSVINFQSGGGGTLILDSPNVFEGKITGLQDGDQIILTSTGSGTTPPNGNEVVAATIGSGGSGQTLYIEEGSSVLAAYQTRAPISILVSGPANDPILTGQSTELPHFFTVSSGGAGTSNYTTLTMSSGSPIALAMGLNQSAGGLSTTFSTGGAGIKIGIISDSFNFLGGEQSAINDGLLPSKSDITDLSSGANLSTSATGKPVTDEGLAMAEVIHAIAPGASIIFQTPYAEPAHSTNLLSAMAQAINQLVASGAQIIVDDIDIHGTVNGQVVTEPSYGGPINAAINSAGVPYFVDAENYRQQGLTIFGHSTNSQAETVAAANWLASPLSGSQTQTTPYLNEITELYSSLGASTAKPDVTAPDGAPTSFSLPSGLDPFFGTSESTAAAGAVAALMMQANPQLAPLALYNSLNFTAISDGEGAKYDGYGFINAPAAISSAASKTRYFYSDPGPGLILTTAAVSQPYGTVATGTLIQFQLTFNEPVTITGAPTFTLNDGGSAKYNANASQPWDGTLIFDTTVTSGQQTPDLEITGFVTASGKITSGGSAPVLSGMFDQPTGLSVNSPVKVTAVTADHAGQEVASGTTVHISMTLNDPVTVTSGGNGGLTLALDDGGTAFYDSGLSTTGTLVFDYAVSGGDRTPDLTVFGLNLASGTTIQSGGFNADVSSANGAATGVQVGAAFVTDVVPSQYNDAEAGTSVTLTIDFSQAVTVSGGAPTLTLNNGGTAFYDSGASSPGSGALVFDYTVSSGQNTPDLEITAVHSGGAVMSDSHGVALDFSAAISGPIGLSIDSPLSVTSITTSQAVFADTGRTVQLAVSMSEAVLLDATEAVALPALILNDGGTASLDLAASNLSGGLLVFDDTVSASEYTTDLQVSGIDENGVTIFDSAGNILDVAKGFPFNIGIGINSFDNWKAGKAGDWSSGADWTSGVPTATTQATILAGGVVSANGADSPTIGSIATQKGATLDVTGGTFTATVGTGIGVNAGAILVTPGARLAIDGAFTNTGSVTASGAGATVAISAAVSNSAGIIAASGANAQVLLNDGVGGDVVISGGTLKTSGGGVIATSGGSATLAGVTVAPNTLVEAADGTLTVSGGTIGAGAIVEALSGNTIIVSGTVSNSGTISLGGSGDAATLQLDSNATLQGPGRVLMSNTGSGAFIVGDAFGLTLTNDSNISGAGWIGSSSHLILVNSGTVDANFAGNLLQIDDFTLLTETNAGTLEATNGGILDLESIFENSGKIEALSGSTAAIETEVDNTGASGVILASGANALVVLNDGAGGDTVISGGTFKTSGGGAILISAGSATLQGATIATSTLVEIANGSLLTLSGGTVAAGAVVEPLGGGTAMVSGTVNISGTLILGGSGSAAVLQLDSNATLQGPGCVLMSNTGSGAFIVGDAFGLTLTNDSNISGGGWIGSSSHLILVNSGTVDANISGNFLQINDFTLSTETNAGTLEATNGGILDLESIFENSGKIEALSGSTAAIEAEVDNTGPSAVILASGANAQVLLNDGAGGDDVISGGTLKTSGGGMIVTTAGTATLENATIATSTLVEVADYSLLILSGGTLAAGAIVKTASAGTAIVSGTVSNTGTFYASGSGSLIDIAGGAVVKGGVVEIGNGVVDVQSGGSGNVVFVSGGSGQLAIADMSGTTSVFAGKISGFGGGGHTNSGQSIDLTGVSYAAGEISGTYSGNAAGGALTVMSGATMVAVLGFAGSYTSGNFHFSSGVSGTVEITDPGVSNGGSVSAGLEIFPHSGLDLDGLAFNAHSMTVGYGEDGAGAAGALVSNGGQVVSIALLGNYLAASFATAPEGQGGAPATQISATPNAALTHPHPA